MAATRSFDPDSALQRLRGNPALLKVLAIAFLEDLPGELNEIRHAVRSVDTAALRAASHRLKGAAMTLSADPLIRAAATLEQLALHDNYARKVAELEMALNELEACASELIKELQAFIGC